MALPLKDSLRPEGDVALATKGGQAVEQSETERARKLVKLMTKWLRSHWEVLSYLFFGVLTTLLNIVLYALFSRIFGYEAANSWGNVLDNFLCILFAYATNRAFVFSSRTTGREAFAEFGKFFACRLGTLVLDAAIMMVGGNLLAAQGAALMEGLLTGVFTHLHPETLVGITSTVVHTTDSSAAMAVIGGADGPTTVFVAAGAAQSLWGLAVKVFSNVVVIVLNYVFSKRIIFKKK